MLSHLVEFTHFHPDLVKALVIVELPGDLDLFGSIMPSESQDMASTL